MKITISGKMPEVDTTVRQIESLDPIEDARFITSIRTDLLKNNYRSIMGFAFLSANLAFP